MSVSKGVVTWQLACPFQGSGPELGLPKKLGYVLLYGLYTMVLFRSD